MVVIVLIDDTASVGCMRHDHVAMPHYNINNSMNGVGSLRRDAANAGCNDVDGMAIMHKDAENIILDNVGCLCRDIVNARIDDVDGEAHVCSVVANAAVRGECMCKIVASANLDVMTCVASVRRDAANVDLDAADERERVHRVVANFDPDGVTSVASICRNMANADLNDSIRVG